jgi:hypothetical protein
MPMHMDIMFYWLYYIMGWDWDAYPRWRSVTQYSDRDVGYDCGSPYGKKNCHYFIK